MRINKFVAQATGLSRRAADNVIQQGRVQLNSNTAAIGDEVSPTDKITLDGQVITPATKLTLIFNKPTGYVTSRNGQGSKTIYDVLPKEYHSLKPIGRLDKDSSGLLVLTNDGELANRLTHPRYSKTKVYKIDLDKPLEPLHQQLITDHGIDLEDGTSRLGLQKLDSAQSWQVTMSEGRNRQIRRTFEALGYRVTKLHRISFGPYQLSQLSPTQSFSIITL